MAAQVAMSTTHDLPTTSPPPPTEMKMQRDSSVNAPTTSPTKATVEPFTLDHLLAVNSIQNGFTAGKACCCCVSYRCCPDSDKDFQSIYLSHPETMGMGAVALHPATNQVIGAVVTTTFGVKASFNDTMMHTCKEGEVYVSWLAVAEGNRGNGAGSQLLRWVETSARLRGATRITLGVVRKNPAIRLYKRFGYGRQARGCCDQSCTNIVTCLCLGSPNGGCGGFMMEKQLTANNDMGFPT